MITIEERVQRIVESNRGNEAALCYRIVHEIHMLRAALPPPAYLESVAAQLDGTCVHEMSLPDGTTFNGSVFLRHTARLVRLAMSDDRESNGSLSEEA